METSDKLGKMRQRPFLLTLTCIGLWSNALLIGVFALALLTINARREEWAEAFGWFGWPIMISGVLITYLVITSVGLWQVKRWGIVLLAPLPITIALGNIVAIAYAISAGRVGWWIFPSLFLVAGSVSWCSKLLQLYRQVSE